jgi:hypothetical protein
MDGLILQVTEVIRLLERTSALFYRQKKQEGFQSLDEALQKLMQLISSISSYSSRINKELIDEKKLNSILEQAMNTITEKDTILLSDLFTFELIPLLEQFNHGLAPVI